MIPGDLAIRSTSRRSWKAALALGCLAASPWPAPSLGQNPGAGSASVATPSRPDPAQDVGQTPKIARPIVREVGDFEEFIGHVEAAQSVEIRPRVGGTLSKIHPSAGGVVEKGTVLFEIDPAPYRVGLEQADAEVDRRKARVQVATSNKIRMKRYADRKMIAQEEFNQASAELDEAEAELRLAVAKQDRAGLELGYTTIAAPIRGRYSRMELSAGNVVVADTTPLGRIDSLEPTFVSFDIDESCALKLRRKKADDAKGSPIIGLTIRVGLADESGFPRAGRVEGTAAQFNAETGTIRCRASVANLDGLLMPRLFARVRLEVGPPTRSILVADSAIGTHDGRKFLRVYSDQARVELRWVKVGGMVDDLRIVKEGLKEGEWVFVAGMTMLDHGAAFDPPDFEPEKVAMPTGVPKAP